MNYRQAKNWGNDIKEFTEWREYAAVETDGGRAVPS